MPPKRGVAAIKKKSKRDKYKYVNSDDEEVSGSGSEESSRQSVKTASSNPSYERKHSTAQPPTPQLEPGSRSRQDSRITGNEQSISHANLERILFTDLQREDCTTTRDTPTPTIDRDPKTPPSLHRSTLRREESPESLSPPINRLSLAKTPPAHGRQTPSIELAAPRATPQRSARRDSIRPQNPLHPNPAPRAEQHFDMAGAYIQPNQQRHMRACMVCSVVRTLTQFQTSGCPNCDHFLELAGNPDAVQDCTSQVFDGLITISDTSKSWVARWQRLEGYVPGVYAVQVEGVLPEDAVTAAENAGVDYRPRDGSMEESLPTN